MSRAIQQVFRDQALTIVRRLDNHHEDAGPGCRHISHLTSLHAKLLEIHAAGLATRGAYPLLAPLV